MKIKIRNSKNLKKEKFKTFYLETENKKLQEIVQLDKEKSFITVGAKIMLDKNSPYLKFCNYKQRK